MKDLNELYERLDWAVAEKARLKTEVDDFLASRPYRLSWHFHLGTGDKIHQVKATSSPPMGIRSRAGCILHETRSILDNLACTLATRNRRGLNGVYFPIAEAPEDFDDPKSKPSSKIEKLSPEDRQKIIQFEPWPTSRKWIGGNDLLCAAHKADVERKHRKMTLSASSLAGGLILPGIIDGSQLREIAFRAGPIDKPRTIAVMGPKSTTEFDVQIEVTFLEPAAIAGKPIVEVLDEFTSLARSILDAFN